MPRFDTKSLPATPDVAAPDGSQVRILLRLDGGSMAHFELAPGRTSIPVAHRTVEELWYILSGRGEMWRRDEHNEEVTAIAPGVSISIPVGTAFQFRSTGSEPLTAVAITMPPWPGEDEAYAVEGKWEPKLT
jgi:mannose-6-phosphate isomerase-like protein (cupin superfamily)